MIFGAAFDDLNAMFRAAVINTNYALEAGLHPKTDTIAIESQESPYANVIVVRSADKDAPWVKTPVESYRDESIKAFINDEFKGALIPTW
jgi:D-methionine transport system substrate-binding protein